MRSPRKVVLYYPQLADPRRGVPAGKDVLPLSVLTLAGWPLRDGYEVELIDGNLFDREQAHRRVIEACEGALLFGTTGILGHQVADGAACARAVRAAHPKLATVIGGWFASVAPRLQLEGGLHDAVVLGQGELTFRELLAAVESGEPLERVAGLALWREDQLVRTAPRPVVGWDRLLNCPWELIDFDRYREGQLRQHGRRLTERLPRPPGVPAGRRHVGIAYYSSFGCPEPCTFCCSPGVTRRRWKAMPAGRVLDDLEELSERWDFDVVRFHDANWGVAEKRAREFCEGKLERGLDFAWFPMMQAHSVLTWKPETLDAFAASGAYVVNIGAETGSEATMRAIGKQTRGDDNLDAAVELDRRGVDSWMTYIIGYPGELPESMYATLDQARRIRAACPGAHPAVWPYQPIPGTPMYEEALEQGFQPPRTLEAWGAFGEYHLDETWPGRIPEAVRTRRRLYQHFATLSHGLARGRVGWWERRARRRLERGDWRLGRLEARVFHVVQGLSSRLSRAPRPAPVHALQWEQGDGGPA